MLLEIMIALGVNLIMTSTPATNCGSDLSIGCYSVSQNTIYVQTGLSEATNRILVEHEIGHALLVKDKTVWTVASSYALPYKAEYIWYILNGKSVKEEQKADLFVEYMENPQTFSVTHPCLYLYFRDKIDSLIND